MGVGALKGISKREGILLLILAAVMAGYMYYVLFYHGINKKIEASKLNIRNYILEMNNASLNRKLFTEFTNQLEDLKSKYKDVKLILPEQEMNPEIVASIQKLIPRNKIHIKSITLGEPGEIQKDDSRNSNNEEEKDMLLSVPVSIVFIANSYMDAMGFIASVEKDKRFVQITSAALTASKSEILPFEEASAKPVMKPQPDINGVEIIVVGEGEQYKEIPVRMQEIKPVTAEKQPSEILQPPSIGINFGRTGTKIEVNLVAKYYYVSNYLH